MEYELTQHAQTVLAEREIPLEWVERTLNAPERLEPDAEDDEL